MDEHCVNKILNSIPEFFTFFLWRLLIICTKRSPSTLNTFMFSTKMLRGLHKNDFFNHSEFNVEHLYLHKSYLCTRIEMSNN